jgi:hypothetical protein
VIHASHLLLAEQHAEVEPLADGREDSAAEDALRVRVGQPVQQEEQAAHGLLVGRGGERGRPREHREGRRGRQQPPLRRVDVKREEEGLQDLAAHEAVDVVGGGGGRRGVAAAREKGHELRHSAPEPALPGRHEQRGVDVLGRRKAVVGCLGGRGGLLSAGAEAPAPTPAPAPAA